MEEQPIFLTGHRRRNRSRKGNANEGVREIHFFSKQSPDWKGCSSLFSNLSEQVLQFFQVLLFNGVKL